MSTVHCQHCKFRLFYKDSSCQTDKERSACEGGKPLCVRGESGDFNFHTKKQFNYKAPGYAVCDSVCALVFSSGSYCLQTIYFIIREHNHEIYRRAQKGNEPGLLG